MGAGDIFRGVAQGLMGAGSGAMNYALERDKEARQREWMLQYLTASKEHKELLPIEEDKIRAEIANLNRKNSGGGGGGGSGTGKQKMLLLYNSKTGSMRSVASPTQPGEGIQLRPGERVWTPGGGGFNVNPNAGEQFFAPDTNGNSWEDAVNAAPSSGAAPLPDFLPSQRQKPPTSASAPASPAPTSSLPPKLPGESIQAYSRRTGIQFK